MKPPRILIAGIGNIFFGDDAFGVEVVRRLAGRAMPDGVRVVDFGIRGIDLAYALTDGCDVVILVDAVQRGGAPGTRVPDRTGSGRRRTCRPPSMEPHSLDPWRVLGLARSLGGQIEPGVSGRLRAGFLRDGRGRHGTERAGAGRRRGSGPN